MELTVSKGIVGRHPRGSIPSFNKGDRHGLAQRIHVQQLSVEDLFDRHLTGGGQRIYAGGLHVPTTIINALIDHVKDGSLSGIELCGNYMNGDITFAGLDVAPERFRYRTYFAGPNERTGMATGSKCVTHIPVHFSDTNRMLREQAFDYAIVQMTPPDAGGYCNIGPVGFEQEPSKGPITSSRRSIGICHAYAATPTPTTSDRSTASSYRMNP